MESDELNHLIQYMILRIYEVFKTKNIIYFQEVLMSQEYNTINEMRQNKIKAKENE